MTKTKSDCLCGGEYLKQLPAARNTWKRFLRRPAFSLPRDLFSEARVSAIYAYHCVRGLICWKRLKIEFPLTLTSLTRNQIKKDENRCYWNRSYRRFDDDRPSQTGVCR